MMLRYGDMWSAWDQADLFLITTNSSTRADGRLVMGAGIARQARDRFSGLDKRLGQVIKDLSIISDRFSHRGREYDCWTPPYRLLVSPDWPRGKLGLFQVKQEFYRRAIPSLIEVSAGALRQWCCDHPEAQVHLNFPGIGNGGLDELDVLPLINELPDSVYIWKYRSTPVSASTPTRVVHWKIEPYDVYIGRPSMWGNPFRVGPDGTRQEVIAKYRAWIVQQPKLMRALPELAGKTLGCWCKPEECHGDVLVELIEQLEKRG